MEGISVILVTAPDEQQAAELAKTLVSERLAACVNIMPRIRSIYSWEGKMEDQAESLCILKTAKSSVGKLRTRLLELHPYDTPEFIEIQPDSALEKYAAWVTSVTG